MSFPRSTHLPEVSGNVEIVPNTGSLEISTGLRNVQSFQVTLAQPPVADAATVAGLLGEVVSGEGQKLTIYVVKADGVTLASVAAKVSWLAIGQ